MKPVAIVFENGQWRAIGPPKWNPWRSPFFLALVAIDASLFVMMVW